MRCVAPAVRDLVLVRQGDELAPRRRANAACEYDRSRQGCRHKTARGFGRRTQLRHERVDSGIGPFAREPLEQLRSTVALGADRPLVALPCVLAYGFDCALVLLFETIELLRSRESLADEPLPHPADAVELLFPAEALLRFVSFVAAAGGVALWLRALDHVDERGHVVAAHEGDDVGVRIDERRVVPPLDHTDLETRGQGPRCARRSAVAPHPGERGGDRALRRLDLARDRDAEAVVPDRQGHRDLQHRGCVHDLPEDSLARSGIADRPERDLVAADGEVLHPSAEIGAQPVELRAIREAEQPCHLAPDGRDVRRGVLHRDLWQPPAVLVEEARRKVAWHLPSGGCELELRIGRGVELREELRQIGHDGREHERLVAVVAGTPIAVSEEFRECQLRDLLAVAEDAEAGLAGEDFTPPDHARRAAADRESVVRDDLVCGERAATRRNERSLGRRSLHDLRHSHRAYPACVPDLKTAVPRGNPAGAVSLPKPWPKCRTCRPSARPCAANSGATSATSFSVKMSPSVAGASA